MNSAPLATPTMPSTGPIDGRADPGGEPFKWDALVARVLNPIQVEIIEAAKWIGLPLAASELRLVFDRAYTLSHLGYHVTALAKLDVLTKVGEEPVRGAIKRYYVLAEQV